MSKFSAISVSLPHAATTEPKAASVRSTLDAVPTAQVVAQRENGDRAYAWVQAEAEVLIAKAYGQHQPESAHVMARAKISQEELESLGAHTHYPPKSFLDHLAFGTMRFLRIFTHMFFREKYDHHAVVLETVAAVPGVVGAAFRHLRSLRRMEKDHGWIPALQEEAENERMHLLIFLAIAKPSALERFLIVCAQAAYGLFYAGLYTFSGQSAHRMVGYLEEEAHLAYTAFLGAIDSGKLPNKPAPEIAIRYYGLPADARLRDVVLRVRADESMHRDFNHMLADKVRDNESNSPPYFMGLHQTGYTGRG